MNLHPNAALIGAPLDALSTPFLMIDVAALEANIAAMAAHCRAAGIKLRPHAKTHKSAEIARRQLAAGAIGICVAKLGEAEAMASCGIGPLLITSPTVTPPMIRRLIDLNLRSEGLIAVIDNPEAATALSDAASATTKPLDVLIDLDVGLHRTGILPEGAVALAEATAGMKGLRLRGLQAYAGHLMHVTEAKERREKSLAAIGVLGETAAAFAAKGLSTEIRTGGGTGSYDIDPEAGILTDLQGGSYVFMDRQYADVRPSGGANGWAFAPALFVVTSVISNNMAGLATTDAGLKAFATDQGEPRIASGAPEGARYFFFGDEQGGVALANRGERLPLGQQLRCFTPHCDPTVNLYDVFHVVRTGRLEALWPVDARGQIS